MSDNNKMRAEFETWAKAAAYDLSQTTDDKYWCVATISAWRVWQAAYAVGRKAEQAEVERLRGEVEILAVEVTRLQAIEHEQIETQTELAAAKTESVCPVEIQSVYVNKYLGSVVVFIGNEKGAVEFDAWLTKRQDKSPPQA